MSPEPILAWPVSAIGCTATSGDVESRPMRFGWWHGGRSRISESNASI